MTQTKLTTVASSKSLAQLTSNLQVGMEDVVNVFIARLEDSLHNQRENLQGQVRNLKTKLEELNDEQKLRKDDIELVSIQTQYVEISQKLDDVRVNWEKGIVSIDVETTTKSRKYVGKSDYYDKKESTSEVQVHLSISPKALNEHNSLNKEIADLTAELMKVNNQLRDMSRKERQVRGVIATKKLTEMGMEDLLNDGDLLAIVNNS